MSARLRSLWRDTAPATLARVDEFLVHLNRVLGTSGGIQSLCYTVAFTLMFVHARLVKVLERRYERLALALAEKASKAMLPGETVLATIEPPKTLLSQTCAGTKALSDLIVDFTFFMRLWGLVGIYNWARDNYLHPPGDAILKLLVWAQVVASTSFQTLENGAYLAGKGVLRGDLWDRRRAKWDLWSNRCWCAQVVLEGLRLLRVRQLRYNEDFGAKAEGEGSGIQAQSEELKQKWKREWYANAGWFSLTLQWSFEDQSQGPVSDSWIALSGFMSSAVGLRQIWADTADVQS